jgi:hypothetical protein
MPVIHNRTPFSVDAEALFDSSARQCLIIIVSASFQVGDNGELLVPEEQRPVRDTDEYYGEPGRSSLWHESDVALGKTKVDVLVNGTAFAPNGGHAERLHVTLSVGELRKSLLVSGNRFWILGTPSAPQPFETMPIRYERAFGGTNSSDPLKVQSDPRNPVGVGFAGALPASPDIVTEIANIEYPDSQISSPQDRPPPAGFGPLCRFWTPRSDYAGTYDAEWLRSGYPLLPKDFDVRFFECAPRDQQLAAIDGGEVVRITNMTPDGTWGFRLPRLTVPIRLLYADRTGSADLKVDTLLIEPDARRFTLTARSRVPFERNRGPLQEVVVGHVTNGWWRAAVVDKPYLDWSGRDGWAGEPSFIII